MRTLGSAIALILVASCSAPTVPDSGAAGGVGFTPYSAYSEQQLLARGSDPAGLEIPAGSVSGERVLSGPTVPTTSAVTLPPASGTATPPAAATATGPEAQPTPAPASPVNRAGISDEQDFEAVASRETIESDRERLAALRQSYEVVEPTALPTRSGAREPSIVEYALSTTNRIGEKLYRRSGVFAQSRFDRNCAKYPSSDMAQLAFLKAGGPKVDRYGLDPDGDGFACYWNPAPFRLAAGGQ